MELCVVLSDFGIARDVHRSGLHVGKHQMKQGFVQSAVPFRLLALSYVLAGWVLTGCDDGPHTTPPPTSQPTATTTPAAFHPVDFASLKPTEPSPHRPGFVVGRILGPNGKPVTLKGGAIEVQRIELQMNGVLNADASDANLRFEADPDGTYMRKLQSGTYNAPTGRIEFRFQDRTFRLPLVPILNEDRPGTPYESANGVVQDFAWRLTGPRPGSPKDEEKPDSWIGGSIYADYVNIRAAERRTIRTAPLGTKILFTVTPKSLLADGTTGKPITLERKYKGLGTELDLPLLRDLPLAQLELRGVEIFPDGKQQSLLFLQKDGKSWTESVSGTFLPDLDKASIEPVRVKFTRKED